MAFRNPAIAGQYLVRPAIQSPNYVLGSQGWSVNRDGTVEFNSGTFRGSISVGPPSGNNFIINNPNTQDIVDVYSGTTLVAYINNQGDIASIGQGLSQGDIAMLSGGALALHPGNNDQAAMTVSPAVGVQGAYSTLSAYTYTNESHAGQLTIHSQGIGTGASKQTVTANERGITGSVAVSDQGNSTKNLFHVGSYSGTTNASGHVVFNHGCQFTPLHGFVIGTAPGGTFANLTYGLSSLTATQADVNWTNANTNTPWASSFITFDMLFFG